MHLTQAHTSSPEMRARLSTLWIFAILNYLYCDLLGLMDHKLLSQYLTGTVNDIHITRGFLLGAAILMEIPIAMVLLARLLPYRANRLANIIAGGVMTAVQIGTLFLGSSTVYYVFFSILEIACTALIVQQAWTWRIDAERRVISAETELAAVGTR